MDSTVRGILNPEHPDLLGEAEQIVGTNLWDILPAEVCRQWEQTAALIRKGSQFQMSRVC